LMESDAGSGGLNGTNSWKEESERVP
jgi:hypothetical protein